MNAFSGTGFAGSRRGSLMNNMPSNATSEDVLNAIPTHLLESFLPGFGILSRVLEASFGINVTSLVSFCFIVAAIAGTVRFLGGTVLNQFRSWFTSTVIITSTDKLYEQVMHWQSKQDLARGSRSLTAKTNKRVDDAQKDQIATTKGSGGANEYNYSELDARTPPVYAPAYGNHYFRHNGRFFIFRRERNKTQSDIQLFRPGQAADERETIQISCLGRSAEPVKRLLMECKALDGLSKRSTTSIRRAHPQSGGNWASALTRPSRPLHTVYMDEDLKQSLLADIRDFLHPAAPRFYARRGIPYRRGFLFHGPPGTGKTSLSFALAGTFGFELHVISLLEPHMSDQTLARLFSNLPSRCIVLLEDVDTAGLEKRNTAANDKDAKDGSTEAERPQQDDAAAQRAQVRAARMARASQPAAPGMPGPASEGVTLSGLLNAIDGVASQEGRILIMTTNDPETLDQALIRPGRVDMQVYFGHASKADARKVFVNMFSFFDDDDADVPAAEPAAPTGHSSAAAAAAVPDGANGTLLPNKDPRLGWSKPEIEAMAESFTEVVPDGLFTPAEIQGFLLMRRKSPALALKDAPAWSRDLAEAKRLGANVIRSRPGEGAAGEGKAREKEGGA